MNPMHKNRPLHQPSPKTCFIPKFKRNKTKNGSSLVGLLASAGIIMVCIVVFMYGSKHGLFGIGIHKSTRKDNLGITVPGAARDAALDTVCKSNLSQIRQSIAFYKESNGQPPASLKDLQLPQELLHDPIDHSAYVYDPTTGTVHCTHPGHENY